MNHKKRGNYEWPNTDPSKQGVLHFNQKSMMDKKGDSHSIKQGYNKVQKVEVEAEQTQAGTNESN